MQPLAFNKPMDELPLMQTNEGIVLFHPNIGKNAKKYVNETLDSRWIGQGPRVNEFEKKFSRRFGPTCRALAVGSGTDALHLAYILSGLEPGDEVIAPVFTCTATNIPFLYMGVKIVFADVEADTLNIDVDHARRLITPKTKAIVCVHYGGLPCNLDALHALAREYDLKVIEDAAHALGAQYKGNFIGDISDFTMFSFQAIKHITTGDGGMLMVKDHSLAPKGDRIRWFGIDRSAKQNGHWENDITEIGYKYQMTDIAASLGLAALEDFNEIFSLRRRLFARYTTLLQNNSDVQVIGADETEKVHAAWMMTILAERRTDLQRYLRGYSIESSQVHYRNDRYTIFGGRQYDQFPNMDALEDKYLVLPLHTKMKVEQVDFICDVLSRGW